MVLQESRITVERDTSPGDPPKSFRAYRGSIELASNATRQTESYRKLADADYAFLRNIIPLDILMPCVVVSVLSPGNAVLGRRSAREFLKMRLNCDKDIHGSGTWLILVTRFS